MSAFKASRQSQRAPGGAGKILTFFSKPITGIIGSIASIFGTLLSIYLFHNSASAPELIYFVSPARIAIYRAGETSRLKVSVFGKPTNRSITAAQVAFWNGGRAPIRSAQVLEPLTIKFPSQAIVVEAQIRRSTRRITEASVISVTRNSVTIGWRILENRDGGVAQVIFEGAEDTPIEATATVEGQPRIINFADKAEIRGSRVGSKSIRSPTPLGWMILLIALIQIAVVSFTRDSASSEKGPRTIARQLILPIAMALAGVVIILTATPPPPFDF